MTRHELIFAYLRGEKINIVLAVSEHMLASIDVQDGTVCPCVAASA